MSGAWRICLSWAPTTHNIAFYSLHTSSSIKLGAEFVRSVGVPHPVTLETRMYTYLEPPQIWSCPIKTEVKLGSKYIDPPVPSDQTTHPVRPNRPLGIDRSTLPSRGPDLGGATSSSAEEERMTERSGEDPWGWRRTQRTNGCPVTLQPQQRWFCATAKGAYNVCRGFKSSNVILQFLCAQWVYCCLRSQATVGHLQESCHSMQTHVCI